MRIGRRAKAPDVLARAAALGEAIEAGRDHMPAAGRGAARVVVDRIEERLGLSGDHTVVALVGATGSGKSSLFNQIAGIDLAIVGVRRPTTMETTACIWGTQGASALMDWLNLPAGTGSPASRRWTRAARASSRAWCCSTCRTSTRPRPVTARRSSG